MRTLLEIISLTGACAYAVVLIVSYIGFVNFRTKRNTGGTNRTIAVVIAARNEAQNLPRLFEALERQDGDQAFEVIVVDDGSSDGTFQIAQSQRAKRFRLSVLPCGGVGKKDGLTTAVYSTEAEIILVTDADCLPGRLWVQTMAEQFSDEACHFVGGSIRPKEDNGIVGSALATETIFLQVVSIGMFRMGNPMLCNGASMGFRRRFFMDTGGFTNDLYASGDDISLLHKAKLYMPGGIKWVTESEAMVEAPVAESYPEAIEQRHRWLSKIKAYGGTSSYFTAILFLGIQLLLPLTLAGFLFFGLNHNPFLAALGIKIVVELLLLSLAASFFRETSVILMFPVSVIAYCVISIGAVIQLMGGDVKWKGRIWRYGKVR